MYVVLTPVALVTKLRHREVMRLPKITELISGRTGIQPCSQPVCTLFKDYETVNKEADSLNHLSQEEFTVHLFF